MTTTVSCAGATAGNGQVDAYVRRLKLDPVFNYLRESEYTLSPRTHRLHERFASLGSTDTLPMSHYLAFFNAVAADVDDPCLGARVCGRRFSPTLAPLCELFLHADSLYAALLDLNRHSGVLQSGTETLLSVSQGEAHMSYQVTGHEAQACRQDTEFSLFLLIYQMQLRLGRDWRPQAIHFRHAVDERHAAMLRDWVDAPVIGACEHNEIIFAAAWLGHRHQARTLAPDVQLFFRQHIDQLCERHPLQPRELATRANEATRSATPVRPPAVQRPGAVSTGGESRGRPA